QDGRPLAAGGLVAGGGRLHQCRRHARWVGGRARQLRPLLGGGRGGVWIAVRDDGPFREDLRRVREARGDPQVAPASFAVRKCAWGAGALCSPPTIHGGSAELLV